MNEKLIEKKLIEGVAAKGGLALKFWPTSFAGLPDRIVLMPGGKVSFVELKSTGQNLRPRQHFVIDLLRKLGFWVVVIDTAVKLEMYLSEI